jgi:hypothetical protein
MGEYLNFDKLITPTLVRVLFWISLVAIVLTALGEMFSGFFWRGVLILVLGPLGARVYCEIVIVIFQINNILTEIRDGQRAAAAQTPASAAAPPAP